MNAFLASARMRKLADTTNRDYAYSLALWLDFLDGMERQWWEASADDAEEFQFWRMTDPANDDRVEASSFARDLAACKTFYGFMGREHETPNPFEGMDRPRGVRKADVKWLDPAAVARWKDLGLRGRDLTGRPDRSWRGRNEQRDSAFYDGLYGTGLRLFEWGSVVLPELPPLVHGRGYFTCTLADSCAKGGYGHSYWMPRSVLASSRAYIEGARARAVRRAQAAGRYESVRNKRLVVGSARHGKSVMLEGAKASIAWNSLKPPERRKLFRQTAQGLEPLSLWLNEDGLPRDDHGWHHTFATANKRIEALGLPDFTCTAHMLRHSCALRWFAIGKLIRTARLAHLSREEARDFRSEFGDTWHLVQTILGHRRVETTKGVYLEPFQNLEVELLLLHAEDFPVAKFMADVFANHAQVRTDPMAGGN
ncbi:site-specific integrase [Streptomyces sp. 5.8]|uniref:site-specific integrase n=1 Tax=Streptomyces sp. 5.8 TaxID=3406571 RepID=UPI003BB7DEEA